mmetsp:Transcript_32038/g.102516  ORF Transcript_32038/g.102516 Transcript_32038/m.102516 type:complete len:238 (+) Transcript_32038:97-810(+)
MSEVLRSSLRITRRHLCRPRPGAGRAHAARVAGQAERRDRRTSSHQPAELPHRAEHTSSPCRARRDSFIHAQQRDPEFERGALQATVALREVAAANEWHVVAAHAGTTSGHTPLHPMCAGAVQARAVSPHLAATLAVSHLNLSSEKRSTVETTPKSPSRKRNSCRVPRRRENGSHTAIAQSHQDSHWYTESGTCESRALSTSSRSPRPTQPTMTREQPPFARRERRVSSSFAMLSWL